MYKIPLKGAPMSQSADMEGSNFLLFNDNCYKMSAPRCLGKLHKYCRY